MNTQKLKTSWLKTMAAAFAAAVMAAGAQGAEKITVDEVANHYPWDGKVDCVTTLSGLDSFDEYEGVFTLSVKKDGAKVSQVVTNAFASADGTYTNTFDCSELFGAGFYPNGSIAVNLVKKENESSGVQLWAGGPHWAKCNVGATQPQDYGYHFMWGDTNAYVFTQVDGYIGVWKSATSGEELSGGFRYENCPTYQKDISTLVDENVIDSTSGNLTAAYDAATVHLGESWRMPTADELSKLLTECSCTWTNNWNDTDIAGYVVTGKTDGYTEKSIFLPAAGDGWYNTFNSGNDMGNYWSSTPTSDDSFARRITFHSESSDPSYESREKGFSIRPVRAK